MKKNLKYIIPVVLLTGGFLFLNQFSCSRSGDTFSAVFGNREESPIKKEIQDSRAFEVQNAFRKIFDLYRESVVYITTEQFVRVRTSPFFDDPLLQEFFGRGAGQGSQVQKRTGLGTGFIISKDGYICTNYHVVAGVDKVFVTIHDKPLQAQIIGGDKHTDIALLKVNAGADLRPVYLGDSDKVSVGDWAIAIGNPFGLDRTFTVGVISAVGRSDVDMMGGSHIQTDASINPGNSGGPLINIFGEVIGINRMIYSQSGGYMGIGFAIPINTARSILAQLKQYKSVKRGYLGVSILNLSEQNAGELGIPDARGAFVGQIVPHSPADRGGLRVGDVIIEINGTAIRDHRDLQGIIERAQVGQQLKITVWRKREKMNFFIRIEERPHE
jgi:Do/DeqQ family serine protease